MDTLNQSGKISSGSGKSSYFREIQVFAIYDDLARRQALRIC